MIIFVEVEEAAGRLAELMALVERGDEIILCREAIPLASLTRYTAQPDPYAELTRLMSEGRKSVAADATSDHSDLYDEHGLPK
jgi:antitoxin (DNA-binding transcriptional repressor) of toxin-antitoxin stability system